jgi:hypothetical protein
MMGDWLVYGSFEYGSKYAEAVAVLGLEEQTLRYYSHVAGRFAEDRRRSGLSFSHHKAVVALGLADQERILDVAEAEGWSKEATERAARDAARVVRSGDQVAELEDAPLGGVVESARVAVARLVIDGAEVGAWAYAADEAGVPLVEWARRVLNDAAGVAA